MRSCKSTALLLALALIFAYAPVSASAEELPARRLELYWQGDADIETSDVWAWMPGKDGRGYLFESCDYGFVCVIEVSEDTDEVGFIVRTNCSKPGGTSWGEATKDFADDRFAVLTGDVTKIYLKSGDGMQYTSPDGGKTLNEIRIFKQAGMISENEIRYTIAPAERISDLSAFSVYGEEGQLEISKVSSLGNKVVTGVITLSSAMDISRQYTLKIDGYGEKPVIPTEIFSSKSFVESYTYDGNDLGATTDGSSTVFKLWAPSASEVVLNLFEQGDTVPAFDSVNMTRAEKGVWQAEYPCGSGTYYTYSVTTAAGTQETVDPYAKAAGVNGDRGMVVDLASTDPEGFENDRWRTGLNSYDDAVIYELHVRDFSIALNGSAYPGKYLAFTESGLTNAAGVPVGVDYIKSLGVTHVHLQPVYDYATVDERDPDKGYNWGYDPKNYNVPEGSYSTDPYHGEVRINEFKRMVSALHAQGLGVVMDVVYNHTADANSFLNKTVPYYYYRYTASGDNSNGSGCGNETASERAMFRKYMIDSVTYWAQEYHIDGFRFDLMALHDTETMQLIEQALHAINSECIIYGEGWTGGTSALMTARQATQANIVKIKTSEGAIGGISVFDDAIRDGLKGSVFDTKDTGYINGSVNKMNAYKVLFGLTGGKNNLAVSWRANNGNIINYMSCHDNLTLYDKLTLSRPDASLEEICAMQRLGAAAVYISRGTPFMLAGEEMLRTKMGDSNSYNSSDEINHIDWESLVPGSDAYEMSRYYKELIALRAEKAYLRSAEVSGEVTGNLALTVTYSVDGETVAFAVINPNTSIMNASLPEGTFRYVYGGEGEISTAVPVKGGTWALLEKE